MSKLTSLTALAMSMLLIAPPGAFASSHREAPITALDHAADITDFYAFVSYDHPDRVTFILNVDPFLEPSNGPNYFPFDPAVLYEIKVDNNYDASADVTFQFRFQTQIRAPQLFSGFAGAGGGLNAPGNSPAPVPPVSEESGTDQHNPVPPVGGQSSTDQLAPVPPLNPCRRAAHPVRRRSRRSPRTGPAGPGPVPPLPRSRRSTVTELHTRQVLAARDLPGVQLGNNRPGR